MVQEILAELVNQYGYLGIFLVSLISNGSIILPIPYLFVIYSIGASHLLDPILVSIISGLGAAIGEFTLYVLAVLGRFILPESYKERADKLRLLLGRYGAIVIFFFALTPLPDDIIYPILGVMRYSVPKLLISCFLGKALLSFGVYMAGVYSSEFVKVFLGGESLLTNIMAVVIGIVLAIILLRIEWEKYIDIEKLAGEDR